jgi:hypothetical protein
MKLLCTIGRGAALAAIAASALSAAWGQAMPARKPVPNLAGNIERPLRYRPEAGDFVGDGGTEFFNRPLYGGNTAFRVDGGDKPEFLLYLPGRGGNLRLAARSAAGVIWLHDASRIRSRYRPGELLYEIEDPVLGSGSLLVEVLAYDQTEGLIVRASAFSAPAGLELGWAYGGINGQRGSRDGDIGTERVLISQFFHLAPAFCRGNTVRIGDNSFIVSAEAATVAGSVPAGSRMAVADAGKWDDLPALLASAGAAPREFPVVVGWAPLGSSGTVLLSLQRLGTGGEPAELSTYREVSADRGGGRGGAPAPALAPMYGQQDLPGLFEQTRARFASLRSRVSVDTPDPFLDAAVGALNVAADALWDGPQQAIMHGAVAWRTRLLGWRGPYALDDLGWHERSRVNALGWSRLQNTDPILPAVPAASESTNLARNEAGLHSNGDISNSHYDMNLVFIDSVLRHMLWTGDTAFAREMWPVIERHLAWERRLFRRTFGTEHLPLYEAYAAIWASDNLEYSGGGAAHATAYNYFQSRMAARLAPLAGADPRPYEDEARLISRGMRELLWLPGQGGFAEYKDLLGLQRVHPDAALWTFYTVMDSGLPTSDEAWAMARKVDREIPHLPVAGAGVPAGLHALATSDWMPYEWSLNNVVMAESLSAALGFWQAGRPEEAWRVTKGSIVASMYMGICPGNVGTLSYLDVYRRESQRDFGDGAGAMARAIVEGLFGVRPDALSGELCLSPGFPAAWDHARLVHPDLSFSFRRSGARDTFVVEPSFAFPQRLRLSLAMGRAGVAAVEVNHRPADWRLVSGSAGRPRVEILAPAAPRTEITVTWSGEARAPEPEPPPAEAARPAADESATRAPGELEAVDLAPFFNDRVTRIFRNEYRSPRSPFVSLALPKQGIGGWAGDWNATADIDDRGLRAAAARNGGWLVLPNGVRFLTPAAAGARNIIFTSRWENYPAEATVPLHGHSGRVYLLMAGSTGPMQSRTENGEVVVAYRDGASDTLALVNPQTWWPIEQDYFTDAYQFRIPGALPTRVNLATGEVRVLDAAHFSGTGGRIAGGAATVLSLPLSSGRELRSITVRALANDVVIGLMAATLER